MSGRGHMPGSAVVQSVNVIYSLTLRQRTAAAQINDGE